MYYLYRLVHAMITLIYAKMCVRVYYTILTRVF